jgi:uncharacterized iron-regulated protein
MSTRAFWGLFLGLLTAIGPSPRAEEPDLYHLPIGDAARRERTVDLILDAVTDCRSGEVLTPSDLPARLAGVELLFVGERHVSTSAHEVQLRVIESLVGAGRDVAIGLEMYPYTQQRWLDQWTAGLLTEEGFVELSEWYEHWGYHWDYYRDIFLFARDHGLRIHALNTPRDVIRAVRQKGLENLGEEEARHVPQTVDTDSEDHLALFKAIFEADSDDDFHASLPEDQLRAMFEAQCTWDATMAHHAVEALSEDGEGEILVVLVGAGHLAYELGIQRQARQWFDGGMATLIPIPVGDACEPVETVRASYADFLWGVPPEGDPAYPTIGVSTMADPGSGRRKVIYVASDSPAEAAGFEIGDLLLEIDGRPIAGQADLKRTVAGKRWGDRADVAVERDGERVVLDVRFRRVRPEPCEEDDG